VLSPAAAKAGASISAAHAEPVKAERILLIAISADLDKTFKEQGCGPVLTLALVGEIVARWQKFRFKRAMGRGRRRMMQRAFAETRSAAEQHGFAKRSAW
jgi:hypothetical protein